MFTASKTFFLTTKPCCHVYNEELSTVRFEHGFFFSRTLHIQFSPLPKHVLNSFSPLFICLAAQIAVLLYTFPSLVSTAASVGWSELIPDLPYRAVTVASNTI